MRAVNGGLIVVCWYTRGETSGAFRFCREYWADREKEALIIGIGIWSKLREGLS